LNESASIPIATEAPIDDSRRKGLVAMTSPCRIRILPDLLVNKIAAGEVVERPASVVKELLENSLDAGASRISITIEGGGRDLIRVVDDGCGMTPEELALSVRSHATSKITAEDDLYAIRTMGFRGEALASIASVSRMRLLSRVPDATAGFEVRVAGEQFESSQPTGCPTGTTVEVRDLFFNVPARRKFLRAPSTEVGHINEQFARLALAHPRITYQLTSNGRLTQNLPACETRLDRIARFYGAELASALLHVRRDESGMSIEAFLAPPSQSRATAQWQYTYVNGRYIRDRFLQHAIREAYRGLIEPSRYGVVYLFLEVDPLDVDVNVHPTKLEVRWADSNLVHSQVLSALRETFQRCDLSPALRTDRSRLEVSEEEQERMRMELASMLKTARPMIGHAPRSQGVQPPSGPFPSSGLGEPLPENRTTRGEDRLSSYRDSTAETAPWEGTRIWETLYGRAAGAQQTDRFDADFADGPTESERSSDSMHDRSTSLPDSIRPRAVQMHNLYLVAETEEGIVIIDQHALHERVMYEQLRQRLLNGPLEAQRLLLPETIRVTAEQTALLEASGDLLRRLGIDVSPFGVDSVAVHTFPALLKDMDVIGFMHDLLDRLAQQPAQMDPEALIHRILDMMACKAAVKAGDRLTPEEIDALIAQRHMIERASSCPHGRPTMLRLTKADLNRQFKRT